MLTLCFRASTTAQEAETGASLTRLPPTQPASLLNTIGNITMTIILPQGTVTNLQVAPEPANSSRLVPR